jgi:tripartite-type tricarboxylate transporter receptor subunit TctC
MAHGILALLMCLMMGATSAQADDYPSRNIRIIVPFSAGGAIDVLARMMAKNLSEKLGQQVYVENKPGASGNIGSDLVAKAPPDGYTVLITASTLIVNPVVAAEPAPFDPLKDFSYITLLARGPLLFMVHPTAANSVSDYVAKAKAEPHKHNMATGGLGGAGHMASEYFKVQAGLTIPVVLYRGTGPAFTDLIGGHITGMLDPLSTALPLTQDGKTKAIAISSLKRVSLVPDVPTLDESGYPGFEFYTWYGLWAPPNLPPAIAQKLAAAVKEIGTRPDIRQWFETRGLEFSGLEGREFLEYAKADQAKHADIMKKAKIERR